MASFWTRLLWGPGEAKAQFALDSRDAYEFLTGGREASTGDTVTVATAFMVSSFLSCVRVISEDCAQTDLKFYDRGEDRTRVREHPVLSLLTRRPNEWQTGFEFRETMMMHVAATGNAFVFVNRVGRNREPRELIPIPPERVRIERMTDLSLQYLVTAENGSQQRFGPDAIWHMRGPSWDGWQGMSPVRLAREALGLAMATEKSHAKMHKNGVQNSGVYSVTDKLSPDQFKMLRDWLVRNTSGDLSGSPLILDRGASWTSQAMKGVDAQHLETRKFQVEEVCRDMRVMPIMIGYSDKAATYASSEQMFLAHKTYTVQPWSSRWAQSAERALLSEDENIQIKFDLKSLMKASALERAQYYSAALGSGGGTAWMTREEVREDDDLDWKEGGDEFPVATNIPAAAPAAPANDSEDDAEDEDMPE